MIRNLSVLKGTHDGLINGQKPMSWQELKGWYALLGVLIITYALFVIWIINSK